MVIPNGLSLIKKGNKRTRNFYVTPRYPNLDTYFYVMNKYDVYARIYNRLGKWYIYYDNKNFRKSVKSFREALLILSREVEKCEAN